MNDLEHVRPSLQVPIWRDDDCDDGIKERKDQFADRAPTVTSATFKSLLNLMRGLTADLERVYSQDVSRLETAVRRATDTGEAKQAKKASEEGAPASSSTKDQETTNVDSPKIMEDKDPWERQERQEVCMTDVLLSLCNLEKKLERQVNLKERHALQEDVLRGAAVITKEAHAVTDALAGTVHLAAPRSSNAGRADSLRPKSAPEVGKRFAVDADGESTASESSEKEEVVEPPKRMSMIPTKIAKSSLASRMCPGKATQRKLHALVTSVPFEVTSCVITVVNALFIGFETNLGANRATEGKDGDDFIMVHMAFNVLFVGDLALRIGAYGWPFFYNADWRWNLLDTVLVTTSTLGDVFFLCMNVQMNSAGRSFRIIRVLRLCRTVRIVRMLKSVREFNKMVYAMLSCMRTLLCSLLILFFVMYFFAILFCQAYTEYTRIATIEGDSNTINNLREMYSTLPRTFYYLFTAASDGMSWHFVMKPMGEVGMGYGVFFVFYITIVLFGVMNVVTSVFVESAIMSAQHYKDLIISEKQHEREIATRHMKQVFRQIDEDGSGEISMSEMEEFLQRPDLRKYIEALNINPRNVRMLFRLLDQDGSKKIDIDEFCEGCLRLQGEAKSFDVHMLIFQMRTFWVKWSHFTEWIEARLGDGENFIEEPDEGQAGVMGEDM